MGKNMSQGQKIFIFDIFFLNIHHTKQNHDKHDFLMKMRKKRGVLGHVLLDWPIEVLIHKLYNLWQLKISVKLFGMISHGDVEHFVTFDRNLVIIFALKCVEKSVYSNKAVFSILILPTKSIILVVLGHNYDTVF